MSDTAALMKTTNDPRQPMMIIACGYGEDEYYGGNELWELTLMLTNGEAPKPKELITALKAIIRQIEAGNCDSEQFVATANLPPQTTPAAPQKPKQLPKASSKIPTNEREREALINEIMAEYLKRTTATKTKPRTPAKNTHKLSQDQHKAIQLQYHNGKTVATLAEEYAVSKPAIRYILNRKIAAQPHTAKQ